MLALETANPSDLPEGKSGLLLHGLYVNPLFQKQGVGRTLIEFSMLQVTQNHCHGLLVKAQPDANRYFQMQGFENLPVTQPEKEYAHRWWKPFSTNL